MSISYGHAAEYDDDKCIECEKGGGQGDIVDDWKEGVRVCRNCGLQVQGQLISTNREWREFEGGEGAEKNRVGGPDDAEAAGGLSTTTTDGSLVHSNIEKTTDEGKVNFKVMEGTNLISRLCKQQLSYPEKVESKANEIFKRVIKIKHENKEFKGRGSYIFLNAAILPLCMVCIYHACTENRLDHSLTLMCNILYPNDDAAALKGKRQVRSIFKKMKNLEFINSRRKDSKTTSEMSRVTIDRYCKELLEDARAEHKAHNILIMRVCNTAFKIHEKISDKLIGRRPTTITAVAIYLACKAPIYGNNSFIKNIDAGKVAVILRVAESTIKTVKDATNWKMVDYTTLDLPQNK